RGRQVRRPRLRMSITSRDDTSIETDRTREQIPADSKAPIPGTPPVRSAEILCSTDDVIGSARGLRVGGKRRRSCEQQRDRQGERDFAHQLSPYVCRMCPTWRCRDGPSYRARSFGPREYRGSSVELEFDLPAASSHF